MTDRETELALERTGSASNATHALASGSPSPQDEVRLERNPIRRLFKMLGPGLITGASDDDPSGVGTYAVSGASMGMGVLWMALFTFPLMAVVQFICAKIAMVTGEGPAAVLRRYYPRRLLYVVVIGMIVANTINAGVDIGAIAAAVNMFVPVPIPILVIPVAAIIMLIIVFGSYRLIAGIFRWLALALFVYVIAAFFAHPDLGEVLRSTFIPTIRLDEAFIATLVAILGTTISPYLFFWQGDEEVEEERSIGRKRLWQRVGATDSELSYAARDITFGMFVSNVVMYSIILTTAATLFKAGQTHIQSATEAAQALRPLAGDLASALLAVGLIGSGFLAVPILAGSAAYVTAGAFNWRASLDDKPWQAKAFYGVIAASILIGMVINFFGINPIEALFWTSVINGFVAPPMLFLIMLMANNKKIMGARTNSRVVNIVGWTTVALMTLAVIALIVTAVQGSR